MDDMKMPEKMSGTCSVCGMQVDDMMGHMQEMADKGDMGHKEAMDKWMAEHPNGM